MAEVALGDRDLGYHSLPIYRVSDFDANFNGPNVLALQMLPVNVVGTGAGPLPIPVHRNLILAVRVLSLRTDEIETFPDPSDLTFSLRYR